MAVEALDYVDLVKGTLRELGRMKFQQIAQELTSYEIFSRWFQSDKVVFEEGIGIQRTLMLRMPDVARHVGWTDQDNPNVEDLMGQLQVPWRHATTNWSFKYQETLMNRGKALIFNLIQPKRAGAMLSLVEQFESAGWSSPSEETNKIDPFGVGYWVVKNPTQGFNGGLPSGHSTVAGIDLSDAPNFRNYTGTYSDYTKADLIKKMRTMKRLTDFQSPVDINDYRNGRGNRYRVYMNEETISAMEDIGEAQNENLGRDIASIDGVSMAFRGHPMRYVPHLDSDTENPVYFIDHSTFYPYVLKGDYLRESDPIRSPTQHDWYTVYVDISYNYLCVDRRRNGVLHKAA